MPVKKAGKRLTPRPPKPTTRGGFAPDVLDTAARNLAGGSTLKAEAARLGLARGKPLRLALIAHLGSADAYRRVLRGK